MSLYYCFKKIGIKYCLNKKQNKKRRKKVVLTVVVEMMVAEWKSSEGIEGLSSMSNSRGCRYGIANSTADCSSGDGGGSDSRVEVL